MVNLSEFMDLEEGAFRQRREELSRTLESLLDARVSPASPRIVTGGLAGMFSKEGRDFFFALHQSGEIPDWISSFKGEVAELQGLTLFTAPAGEENAYAVHKAVPNLAPRPLGLAPSFGFGDRMGLATPGHVAAMEGKDSGISPIFVQQSIREMERTGRTPRDVMAAGTWGALQSGWAEPVGADADHLKTVHDVEYTAEAGFTFFTIDPSDHVDQKADNYDAASLEAEFEVLARDTVPGSSEFLPLYLDKAFTAGNGTVRFDRPTLLRAAVKYGRALEHVRIMADHIAGVARSGFEIELSVDETDQPTSVPEHLFIALELQRRGVRVVSLAPRFIGAFEKGVDYIGNVDDLAATLEQHAAIAAEYGPYKISLHSGSDKFSVYPLLAKATRGQFHVKTAGTSYLEALRAVGRADESFFREIIAFSRSRFDSDKATYHISATLERTPGGEALAGEDLERMYLDEDNGRQILHVTFGSVLSSSEFGPRIKDFLRANPELHAEVLAGHLGKHIRLLTG